MRTSVFLILIAMSVYSCAPDSPVYTSINEYPTPTEANLWPEYTPESTVFKVWSPPAQKVRVLLYKDGQDGKPIDDFSMEAGQKGLWSVEVKGDLAGSFYTYQVMIDGKWLEETPGIYAQAVGVNGRRAMVLEMESTNPENWKSDIGPELTHPNEAIIYELHVRDATIHPAAGSKYPGKFKGLAQRGTKGPSGISTGLDHIRELGVTHVHLLPSFDFYSLDESKTDSAQFNWGYDPQNYNVPEGSYATDPFKPEVRIREFKEMVKTFHESGIGVILDVVYNHTGRTETSNFNLEVPNYYYRYWEDGSRSDASACGNETASDRAMMRKFIIESVSYWAEEYHIDGFRFDLMAIHDITTMNEVVTALKKINPAIIIYGEGWTAGNSPLPELSRALKKHTFQMPKVSAFSDDIRDGIKGSVFDEHSTGFVSGASGLEETIKFGVIGSILHPEINYDSVNYSKSPWANEPWQAVSYVSCHDNHTLYDKLKISRPDATDAEIAAMDKLANAIVLTSQGTAFIHAGEEILRTKNGEHNSYNKPDSINQIDWRWKVKNGDVFNYYKNLIMLRNAHPAFRMPTGEMVRNNLSFGTITPGFVSYQISNNANGDTWRNILVCYNATTDTYALPIEGTWKAAVIGDLVTPNGGKAIKNSLKVPALSMTILYQE